MAQYDAPITQEEFQSNISSSTLSNTTKSTITALVAGGSTVEVKNWDGASDLTGAASVVVVAPAAPATPGATVSFSPAPVQSAAVKTWIIDTTENISATFDTIQGVIVGGSGNNSIVLTGASDVTIVGGDKTDTFTATSGNVRIEAGTGETTADTGAGFDVVIAKGSAEDYDVEIVDGALVLKTKAGASVADTNINAKDVNFIEFSNTAEGDLANTKSIAVVGDAGSATTVRLYDGLLGRNAESAGAKFWLNAHETGTSVEAIAETFLNSDEFKANGELSNEQFVALLYTQALKRTDGGAADTEGSQFWVNALDNNASRAQVAVSIVGSTEATTETESNIKIVDGWV